MSTTTPVKTSAVSGRRTLRFATIRDVLTDAERFGPSGPTTHVGNWTPGEIVDHLANVIDFCVVGFPPEMKVALPFRLLARLMRNAFLTRPMRAGFTLPSNARAFLPRPGVSWSEGLDHLRRAVAAFERADALHASPAFGAMTKAQWEQLHCRHGELHLSFVK